MAREDIVTNTVSKKSLAIFGLWMIIVSYFRYDPANPVYIYQYLNYWPYEVSYMINTLMKPVAVFGFFVLLKMSPFWMAAPGGADIKLLTLFSIGYSIPMLIVVYFVMGLSAIWLFLILDFSKLNKWIPKIEKPLFAYFAGGYIFVQLFLILHDYFNLNWI